MDHIAPMETAPRIFDRAMLRLRQARAARLGAVTFLRDAVVDDLRDRLAAVNRRFTQVVALGDAGVEVTLPGYAVTPVGIPDDEQLMLVPASAELVVSVLSLQSVNDLPGVLMQIRRSLKPDGLLLATFPGGDSLTELRQSFAAAEAEIEGGVSPRVAPFADVRDAGALLQRAGFALPVADVDRITVRYDDAFALMRELRAMAATNILTARRRAPTRRATLLRMAQLYAERFADADGRIRATFDIVWLSGWAPDASQPKPLKPGSATARLADAVNAARRD